MVERGSDFSNGWILAKFDTSSDPVVLLKASLWTIFNMGCFEIDISTSSWKNYKAEIFSTN